MKFESFRARGMGPFVQEVFVDFNQITGPLIAITGENGAGKSSMLELMTGGAMYRQTATRGSLTDLATARDAFLEVGMTNGAHHVVRHTMDNVSCKGESIVLDAAGVALTSNAKVTEFDIWAKAHLPPREVLYASTVMPQGSGGFLDLSTAARKSVILRALGIEHIEQLAEKARGHTRSTKERATTLDARIEDERGRLVGLGKDRPLSTLEILNRGKAIDAVLPELADELKALENLLALANEELTKASVRLDTERAQYEASLAALGAYNEAKAARDRVNQEAKRLAERIVEIDERLTNNRSVLARAEEIRKAVARAEEVRARQTVLTEAFAEASANGRTAAAAEQAANSGLARARAARAAATSAIARANASLVDKPTVDTAAASLPDLRASIEELENAVQARQVMVNEAMQLVVDTRDQRIETLRHGHKRIIAGSADSLAAAVTIAAAAIGEDNALVKATEDGPALLAEAKTEHERAIASRDARRRDLERAERSAARAKEMAAAEDALARATAEDARAAAEEQAAVVALGVAKGTGAETGRILAALFEERGTLTKELTELGRVTALAAALANAEARVAELEPERAALVAELVAAEGKLSATILGAPPVVVNLQQVQRALDEAHAKKSALEAQTAVKRAHVASAEASVERLRGFEAERTALLDECSDWTRLADDLGQKGLQALEIDAAGPEISEIANQLLHVAHGPRFSVRLETLRVSNGKEIEVFDVQVIDTGTETSLAREGAAGTLSGGERVIVSEAISEAIATVACRRAGLTDVTLVRDETGAALDPVNARRYVQMLRKAAELIGASKVLLVSHSAEIQAMCDARVHIGAGKVDVS